MDAMEVTAHFSAAVAAMTPLEIFEAETLGEFGCHATTSFIETLQSNTTVDNNNDLLCGDFEDMDFEMSMEIFDSPDSSSHTSSSPLPLHLIIQ